jgi:hypothetical protein
LKQKDETDSKEDTAKDLSLKVIFLSVVIFLYN